MRTTQERCKVFSYGETKPKFLAMNFKKMYFLNPVETNITEEKKIYMKKKKKKE